MLLGSLAHSGRVHGVLAERVDQAHLIEAMDAVLRRLGGTTRIWRTDRLATVIVPGTRDVQASFTPVAKHDGAIIEPCPPRRGNRKGVVEAAVRFACGRWWRTMTATTAVEAQASLDRFCSTTADARLRSPGRWSTRPAVGPDHGGRASPSWPMPRLCSPSRPRPTGQHRGERAGGRQRQRGLQGQPATRSRPGLVA